MNNTLEHKIKFLSLLKSIPLEILDYFSSKDIKTLLKDLNLTKTGTKEDIKNLVTRLKEDNLIPPISLFLKKEYSDNLIKITEADLSELTEYNDQLMKLIDIDLINYIEEEISDSDNDNPNTLNLNTIF